jgi:hypothetical protein
MRDETSRFLRVGGVCRLVCGGRNPHLLPGSALALAVIAVA